MPNPFENIDLNDIIGNDGQFDWDDLIGDIHNASQGGSGDIAEGLIDSGLSLGLNAILPGAGSLWQALGGLDFVLNWGSSANPDKERALVEEKLYKAVDEKLKQMKPDNMRKTLNDIDYLSNWFRSHYRNNRKFHAKAPDTKDLMDNMIKVVDKFYSETMTRILTKLAEQGILATPVKQDFVFKTHPKTPFYRYTYKIDFSKADNENKPTGQTKPTSSSTDLGGLGQVVGGAVVIGILKKIFNF